VSLVFLDTSQVSLLEESRRTDPSGYLSFLAGWKRRGCALVLTMTQAGELTRYSDALRRNARYEVLADLGPVRADFGAAQIAARGPQILLHREILRALAQRGLIAPGALPAGTLAAWTEILPGRLDKNVAATLRDLMENQEYRDLEADMFHAHQHEAAAMKFEGRSGKGVHVRELPAGAIPPEVQAQFPALLDAAVALLREQSARGALPPISEDVLSSCRGRALEFLGRAAKVGARDALLERLPITRETEAELLALTRDELVNSSVFESQVRSVARNLLNASGHQEEAMVRALRFADCPGSWLERRLKNWIRGRSPAPEPSHLHDAERIAYLPYVDLLFTDKEMAEFVRQVMRDKSTPDCIRALPPPMAVSKSLKEVEEALDSLHPHITNCAAQPCP